MLQPVKTHGMRQKVVSKLRKRSRYHNEAQLASTALDVSYMILSYGAKTQEHKSAMFKQKRGIIASVTRVCVIIRGRSTSVLLL